MLGRLLFVSCLVFGPALAHETEMTGSIRIWGHGGPGDTALASLLKKLEAGYRRQHPGTVFSDSFSGDDSAIGGLYTGAADLALMERGLTLIEREAYQPIFWEEPLEASIATGGVGMTRRASALVVLVHPANPLDRLTFTQVEAIFGAGHRRSAATIRSWGELGVGGEWKRQAIHVYVPNLEGDDALQFVKVVFAGNEKWTGTLREVRDSAEAAQAVANDRFGIALSTSSYALKRVKPLALADADTGPYLTPTPSHIAARRYPLVRSLSAFLNRPLDARVASFLAYVLSEEGQTIIKRDGNYYRLPPAVASAERRKLP